MTAQRASRPAATESTSADSSQRLAGVVDLVQQRVRSYLSVRADAVEQTDHLRHVADRTRWIYYSELQRSNPGASVRISEHEDGLIQACVFCHDIGKWIPREELQALIPEDDAELTRVLSELKFSAYQSALLLLGLRRRFELAEDGYTPEYDSAHHLVSAFMLVADDRLGFHRLDPGDQERLTAMVVGHQFGGYFKENLLNLSVHGQSDVTTGMLMDISRPDRLIGDMLACSFHDADISDLLFVGSLERRPKREDVLHNGGLIKILMINLANRILNVPSAPPDLAGCIGSCQGTVTSASQEFITATAIEHGYQWQREARRFLELLQEPANYERLNLCLVSDVLPAAERLTMVRGLVRQYALDFLNRPAADG